MFSGLIMILLTVQVYSLHYYLFYFGKFGKEITEEGGQSKVASHMTEYGSDCGTAQKLSRVDFVMSNEIHKI